MTQTNANVITIIGANKYDFIDQKTGRNVQGCNVHHLMNTNTNENAVGQIPAKISFPLEKYATFGMWTYPVQVEVITEQRYTSKGVTTVVIDLKRISK